MGKLEKVGNDEKRTCFIDRENRVNCKKDKHNAQSIGFKLFF